MIHGSAFLTAFVAWLQGLGKRAGAAPGGFGRSPRSGTALQQQALPVPTDACNLAALCCMGEFKRIPEM